MGQRTDWALDVSGHSYSVLEECCVALSPSLFASSLPSALLLLHGFLCFFENVQASSNSLPVAGMSQWVLVGWFLIGYIYSSAFGLTKRLRVRSREPHLFKTLLMILGSFPRQEVPPLLLSLVPLPSYSASCPLTLSLVQESPRHSS